MSAGDRSQDLSLEEAFFSLFLLDPEEFCFDFSSFFDFVSEVSLDSDSFLEPVSALEPESPLEEDGAEDFFA